MKCERIAHRGASSEAPENTLPAIEIAVEKYRVDRVEVDIRLTKDRIPVIFHDSAMDRITNGSGSLASYTLAELKELDAGFWFDPEKKREYPYRKKGVTIPTLEEMLTQFPTTSFCLEIKEIHEEAVPPILKVMHNVKRTGSLIVGSFKGKIVRELRKSAAEVAQSFLSTDEVKRAYLLYKLGFKKFSCGARFASLPMKQGNFKLDDPRWIEFLHHNGFKVFYWTVNDGEEMKRLIQNGADGILSDFPDRLNQILSQ